MNIDIVIDEAGPLGIQFGTVKGRCQVLKVLPTGLVAKSGEVQVGDLLTAVDGDLLEADGFRTVLMQGLRPVRLGFVRPMAEDVIDAVATPTELVLRAQRSELEVLRHWGALHFEHAAAEAASHTTGDLAQKDALTQLRVREFISNLRAARDKPRTDEAAAENQALNLAEKKGLEWGWTVVCAMAGGERGTPGLFRQAASFTGRATRGGTETTVNGIMWLSALWAPRPYSALAAGEAVEVNRDGRGVWVAAAVESVLPDESVRVSLGGELRVVSQLRVRRPLAAATGASSALSAATAVEGWVWKKKRC